MKPAISLEPPEQVISERSGVSLAVLWCVCGALLMGAGIIYSMRQDIAEMRIEARFDRAVMRSIAKQVGAKIPEGEQGGE